MERARERIDLGARVVDVIFAAYRKARLGEERSERIAHHGDAAVPDMKRPGRIDRDIFDIDLAAHTHRRIAIGSARAQNLGKPRVPERIREPQVEEARSRDFGRRNIGQALEPRLQQFGERPRRHLRALRQHHRRVGRKIAVRRIARRLDRDTLDLEPLRQLALAHQLRDRGPHQPLEMRKEIHHVVA